MFFQILRILSLTFVVFVSVFAIACPRTLFTQEPTPNQVKSTPTTSETKILLPSISGGNPAAGTQIAADGQIYGLLGQLQNAVDQPFSTYLVTADQVVFGLVGASPDTEQQIVSIRDAGEKAFAKVWGIYKPGANAATVPTIVVSDIIAAQGDDTTPPEIQGQTSPVVTVKFDLVNIRTGPGNRFPPSGQVTLGQVCDIVARNDLATWLLIDCLGGETGWIDRRLADIQGDELTAPVVAGPSEGRTGSAPTPTPIPPGPTPTPGVQAPPTEYWQTTFYNNTSLSEPPALEAAAGDINFDWRTSSPNPAVSATNYSARFRRMIDFGAGYYRFLAEADDGVRVYIDNNLLIDGWLSASGRTFAVGRYLTGAHIVSVEYYQLFGISRIRFWSEYLGNSPEWRASYYGGVDLLGVPVFEQPEASAPSRPIDYDWGASSPAPGQLSGDFWSGRWIGKFRFETGNYVFNSISDDGVRVYLNDTLVIDEWKDGQRTSNVRFVGVGADNHTVRVEFYERTGNAKLQVWWYREEGSQIAP